jgi:hypothetical protein
MRTAQSLAWTLPFVALASVACGGLAVDASPHGADASPDPVTPPRTPARAADAAADAADDAKVAATIPADGICGVASVSSGVVDPDCVYLLGTLQEGTSWRNVLIDPRHPADRAYGFGNPFRAPIIHPKTGRLWFLSRANSGSQRLYLFGVTAPVNAYPDAQLAGHTLVPTPGCADNMLFEHYLVPDTGVLVYDCLGNPGTTFVDGQAAPVDLQGYLVVAVGNGGVVLGAKTAPDYAIVKDGVATPIAGLAYNTFLRAIRSRPSGGFMALANAGTERGQLIEIEVDGSILVKGPYDFGTPPRGPGDCVLEPSGAAVCIVNVPGPLAAEGVARFTLTSPPEMLHDERTSDVKIHGSRLVTGP